MDTDLLLTTTRTVRRRLDLTRPVELSLVKDCLRVALQAPTGGDRQDWRWIVVTDPDLRRRIGEVYRTCFERRYGRLADDPSRDGTAGRLARSAAYLARNLESVPVLVIPCLDLGERKLPPTNQAGVWSSVLPAAWSYMLAARSRGLAVAWTTVHLDAERECADLLGLPPGVHQAALLPTAHSLGDSYRPAQRLPLEECLHLDGWNA
ncbi:nitroreductase family protein [Streptomyces corynorhini]|uniref:nitroreductase family protein n=1 Tax=Streptomyces corynorhini TaxID=2282652 RepID=UPI001F232D76|nr:nitroreductase family protein [Streptomyces corynorhini]